MRVVVTGGGTGGHIYPAIAIAKGIKEDNPEAKVLFVGTSKGLEADIVPREGFEFRTVTVEGLTRRVSPRVIVTLFKACKGCYDAYRVLKEFKPEVVVGTGGYVCAPVVMTAAGLRIPTLIHEQNAYPGITNRLLARIVDKVAVTFEESARFFSPKADITVTGLPVRPEILSARRAAAISRLGIDRDKFTVLAMGGSRGARSINKTMVEVICRACGYRDLQFLHMTGYQGYEETVSELRTRGIDLVTYRNITVTPYLYNIHEALAAADLVICRAGATTIAEITARGLPSILIPYPFASANHQEYNARALVTNGAAVMILDADLSADILWETIWNLYTDRTRLSVMAKKSRELGKPDALKHLLQLVNELGGK